MDARLSQVLDAIEETYRDALQKGGRHYLEVNVGQQADRLGFTDLKQAYEHTFAIVPLKAPRAGMKVRIDGRTFVHYAELDSGVAVPGYLAKAAGGGYKPYVPLDSMVCNFA